MKENFAEVLESLMLPHEKILERKAQNKFSEAEKEKVKSIEKELSEKQPIEIAKLLVSKIKSDLSNSPAARKLIEEIANELKKEKDMNSLLLNISGFKCVLVTTKDGKFDYIEVPIKNLEVPNDGMARLFELDQIAAILSK